MTQFGKAKLVPPGAKLAKGAHTAALRDLLKAQPGLSTAAACKLVGCGPTTVRNVRRELGIPRPGAPAPAGQAPKQHVTLEEGGGAAVASSLTTRITTLAHLLKATKVDLTVWEAERHVINKWEVAMKEESKTGRVTPIVEPLFQIKIWLKRKAPQVVGLRAMLADIIAEAKRKAPAHRPIRYARSRGDHLAEIDQPDLHLGKLCWAAESGEDYDVKIAETCFKEGIARHRDAAAAYGVGRFLLPIGNDYLNVDNGASTTTGGTPQDEDGRWQRSYIRGRQLLTWSINYLREVAPVAVVRVRGNHDEERGFYLADALECTFARQKDVSIDNAPAVRKYYAFGNSLIGFTHGDLELTKELPLTMAVERPHLWAAAKFREFHCGHLHHKRQKVFQPVLEEKGVIVRHLSSLTAADAWHAGKGYRAQRASSCFIRHPERGVVAELQFNL